MNQAHFSASLIAADFTQLGEQIQAVLNAGANSLHFDVMDHHYVPNLSIGAMVCESIHQHFPDVFIDVHLMVTDPDQYLEPFAKAGASQVSVHPETCPDTTATLQHIESLGMRPGVVFNPDQAVALNEAWYPHLKHLLLMSVFPGFGGQKFIPESVDKIKTARQQLDQLGLEVSLAVDGGISPQSVGDCYRAGADFFVVGSALLRSDNYANTIELLNNHCR